MRDLVLSLCDLTGIFAEPWIEAGYRVIVVDPQHKLGVHVDGMLVKVGHVIDHPVTWKLISSAVKRIAFTAAFPPCTDLAVSGAKWFEKKREEDPAVQFKAMQVVWQCHAIAELIGAPWFIENPVSQISTFWRKPDHKFDPCEFTGFEPADNYTKKTCLWTGGGFVMPQPFRAEGLGEPDDRIHKAAPGPDRANFRSATPRGFSRAVFAANGSQIRRAA